VSDCDGNGRIAALDKTTGEPRWSAPFGGGYSESAAADGVLFTGTQDGIIARRSADGAQQWAADRFGEAQLQVAAGDQVLVIGANDAGPYPRDPTEVVSLDPDTGETRCVTSLDGAGQIVDVAIADDLAIVRTTGTSTDDAGTTVIIGVSLSVGHIRWRHDLGISEVLKPLLVSTDNVVVDLLTWASSSVVVLETATGILRWRIDREFDPDADPASVESYALSGGELAGRLGSELVVWDVSTAEQLGSVPHAGGDQPGGRAWIAGARVISGTPVMVGNKQARLDARALPSGVEQWSQELPRDLAAVASTGNESWVATWRRGEGCD
jgi:outer membrane protein assembly factor BamB